MTGFSPRPKTRVRFDRPAVRLSSSIHSSNNAVWRTNGERVATVAPLPLLLSAAAEGDPALAELRADLDTARLQRMSQVARALAAKTQLRAGRSAREAADIMWAYSSPELYQLLVVSRGWSAARYGRFVGDALVDTLLNPTSAGAPQRARRSVS